MSHRFTEPAQQEVWNTLRALNDAWTKGNPDNLAGFFHRDMVAIAPPVRNRIEGRDACVAAWKGFTEAFKIHSWAESDPLVSIFGSTAVVSYYYEMSCSMGTETLTLAGRDLMIFLKEDDKWWVIADQFSGFPQ